MNTEETKESKAEDVMKAIQFATTSLLEKKNDGIDLLAIAKKVTRNRRKGESLE